ncbi:MAG: hypothetical protein LBU15_02640 [Rickettsiales bacterium]|jgi:serine/threonine protein kinase|nr:hypothetical protein [Rickettsiales bacterium]
MEDGRNGCKNEDFIQGRIEHILMFECGNSFEAGENILVSCAIEGPIMGGSLDGPSPLFFKKGGKEEGSISVDAINRRSWEEARVISGDDFGVKFLFPSRKLGGNVVVKIPCFHIEFGAIIGERGNNILYYISVWKNFPPTRFVPLEFRNLEQVFDYGDIHNLSSRNLVGYPKHYPREIINRSCGVGVTVSEDLSLGRSLGSMDRVAARFALLANNNIYGLIRALWAVQDPKRLSGIDHPHLLIHGNINPNNLVVVWAGDDPIVKICNWDRVVAVPFYEKKGDPFIFKPDELPRGGDREDFEEGGDIRAGTTPYTAPELLHDKGIDTRKIDMFSLAMVLLEMLTLNGPWYKEPWVQQHLGGRPELKLFMFAGTDGANMRWMNEFIIPNLKKAEAAGLPPAIAHIIELCCNLDPKIRLAPEEISTKSVEDAKSALNKVVKASDDINRNGLGGGPGGLGGGSGGLGGGSGGLGGGAQGGLKPEGN